VGVSVLGPLQLEPPAARALGPRDRVVLAALVARGGTPIPNDALADALWSDAPPASWTKVVQGCIVRLRRLLGATAIATEPGGYVLSLPADEIDARRFERLVDRGQQLLALGEPERAWYCLGEALALWRGPALPELQRWDPGRIEAARLDERREEAEEAHLDAALRAGRHREVLATARARVEQAPTRERRWALLALAQYRTGQQADALRTLHDARAMLVRELGIDPGPELQALELGILNHEPDLAPPATPAEASDECPWPGLRAFDVGDSERYFGREDDLAACLRKLRETGVLVIVGPSGSGKSSLARAGVGATLRRHGRAIRVVVPSSARPADVVAGARPGDVLVVDQAEQAMRPDVPDGERLRFLDALVEHAASDWLVVSLRADRTGEVSAHDGFARLVERGLYLLGPMDDRSLRRAVEEPARQAALLLEPGLVDLVVRDVLDEPGGLPLMSHALRETWERREGRTLTVAGYREGGGIRGAVSNTAEALYGEAAPDRQRRLRELMLRLVAPSDGGEPFPVPVPLAVVMAEPGYDHLVEQLVGARLLTSTAGDVQLAHESLARAWPRLRSWLDEDQEGMRVRRHLTAAATGWDAMGRPDSELYRGARLATARDWQGRAGPQLTAVERTFLAASEALSHREREEELQRAQRDARANRRLRALLGAAATLAVVAMAAGVLAARQADRADREASEAARQARTASARELAAASVVNLDADPERSVLLALAGIDATRGADGVVREAEEALRRAVRASRVVRRIPAGGTVAFTSDGSRAVIAPAGERGGNATVWSTETAEELVRLDDPGVAFGDVAVDPTDRFVATSHVDGSVRIWDLGTGRIRRTIDAAAPIAPLAFVDGGRRLAVGTEDGVATWEVATGSGPAALDAPSPTVVLAASPDGTVLAAASYDQVRVLDIGSGRAVELDGHLWPVAAIHFSGDGTRVATAANDGRTRVFDAASGALLLTLPSNTGMTAVAFDEEGSLVAGGATDGTVRVWDTSTGEERARLAGHGTDVTGLAFLGDGQHLTSSGRDGTTRVWDVSAGGSREWYTQATAELIYSGVAYSPDGSLLAAPAEPSGVLVWDARTGEVVARLAAGTPKRSTIAFSPDGTMLASGSDMARSVAVWDLPSGDLRYTLGHESDFVRAVAFSPDGDLVATAGHDGTSRLWDAGTGDPIAVLERDADNLVAVAFDATGDRLATAGDAGVVTVWDVDARRRSRVIDDHDALLNGVAFGPDDTLVTAGSDGTARIYSLRTGREVRRLRGHSGPVNLIAFSPDERLIATSSDDRATRLWDRRSGRELLTLTGHELTVFGVAFSPDGRFLATASADGTTVVHLLDVDELVELARSRVTRSLTVEECRQYLHVERCPAA